MDWETSKENIQPIRRGRNVQHVVDAAQAEATLQKQALLVVLFYFFCLSN